MRDELGERMAIMNIDGLVSSRLETQAIKSQCENCNSRDSQRLLVILNKLRAS
jgi:hypothetical protein